MRVLKEGLHTYVVGPCHENTYYIDIEYPMIKNNIPATILPIQMRKTDGKQEIYYEITGKVSLEEWGEKTSIRYEEIAQFLRNLYDMLAELDEYMLSIHQIVLEKESVFVGPGNQMQWMYGPEKTEDIQKKFEELFLWFLSNADFEDLRGANLIHRCYAQARNAGICKEFLEESLGFPQRDSSDHLINENLLRENMVDSDRNSVKREIYTGDFGEDSGEDYQEMVDSPASSQSKCGKRGFLSYVFLGIRIVLALLDLVLLGYWGYGFYLYGLQRKGIIFCGILLLFLILFISTFFYEWRKHRCRVNDCEDEDARNNDYKNNNYAAEERKNGRDTERNLRQEESSYPSRSEESIFEKLESRWGMGGETVLLSDAIPQNIPALYNEKTHQVVKIQVFPFYIGSEEGLNQLSIANRTVSRQHAVIVRKEEDYYIEDLESTNGTKIDGRKILPEQAERITEGSRLEFSNELWVFHYDISRC